MKSKIMLGESSKGPRPITLRFFKILQREEYSRILYLPPAFVRKVKCLVDKETYLENSQRQRWAVKVSEVGNSLAFKRGWDEFFKQQCLMVGEFLEFHYIEDSYFLVRVYGRSGCERISFNKGLKIGKTGDKVDVGSHKPIQKIEAVRNPNVEKSVTKKARVSCENDARGVKGSQDSTKKNRLLSTQKTRYGKSPGVPTIAPFESGSNQKFVRNSEVEKSVGKKARESRENDAREVKGSSSSPSKKKILLSKRKEGYGRPPGFPAVASFKSGTFGDKVDAEYHKQTRKFEAVRNSEVEKSVTKKATRSRENDAREVKGSPSSPTKKKRLLSTGKEGDGRQPGFPAGAPLESGPSGEKVNAEYHKPIQKSEAVRNSNLEKSVTKKAKGSSRNDAIEGRWSPSSPTNKKILHSTQKEGYGTPPGFPAVGPSESGPNGDKVDAKSHKPTQKFKKAVRNSNVEKSITKKTIGSCKNDGREVMGSSSNPTKGKRLLRPREAGSRKSPGAPTIAPFESEPSEGLIDVPIFCAENYVPGDFLNLRSMMKTSENLGDKMPKVLSGFQRGENSRKASHRGASKNAEMQTKRKRTSP